MRPFQTNKPLVRLQLSQQRLQQLQWLLAWGIALAGVMVLAGQAWLKITNADYRIQEDGRQHIFWMLRYVNPDAFPNDLIADYFQAMAPWLYRALYAMGWQVLGIEPYNLTFGLPLVLGLIAVSYAVMIGRQLSPMPLAAGLAGLLCAQTLWMEDDLVSATPRAFATPLMLAFLFYALRRNSWGCGLTIAMQGGLYPPAALISWGTTCLRLGDRRNWRVWLVSTIGLGLGLLPLVLGPEPFGPMVTLQDARSMLEFYRVGDEYGRAFFFHDNPLIFWGFGPRSGFFFWGLMAPLNLAVLGWFWLRRRPVKTPQIAFKKLPINPDSRLLWQFIISVILFYAVAHLVLFKLHFPARYPYHGFRTVLPIAAAIVLAEMIRWQIHHWQTHFRWQHRAANLALVSLQLVLLLLPFFPALSVENQLYATGRATDLYEYLKNTPSNTLVATLGKEGNNLPIFAKRSTLVSGEYALPYHPAYYNPFQQRTKDLLDAYVATDREPLMRLLDRYPITHLLVRKDSFTADYLYRREWLYPFQPELDHAMQQLNAQQQTGEIPLLQKLKPVCTVLKVRNLSLIEANCIRDRLQDMAN
ncbi:MAG: hypothetical protein F6K42_09405 [Leptolyngbya sp. SIO1D8]|nr:hypothetical protein [Leptolyngbya sp. SIO1D8]